MSKVNFSVERINGFTCPFGKEQAMYWDAKAPGLGVRVTQAGAKSYIFSGKLLGETIRLTIGDVKTWKLSDAQTQATAMRVMVQKGIDPRKEKENQKARIQSEKAQAARESKTVGDVWEAYIEEQRQLRDAAQSNEAKVIRTRLDEENDGDEAWSDRHFEDHLKLVSPGGEPKKRGKGFTKPGPLAPVMKLRCTDLTSEVVQEWLRNEKKSRPTRAALAYRVLRAFVNWAKEEKEYKGLIPHDACTARLVRKAVPKPKAKKRDKLQREQLVQWFKGVQRLSPTMSIYLQTLLLTGARREEIAEMRWEHVDLRWRTLIIADKVEGRREIPLTPYLASLLEKLKEINETPPTARRLKTLGIELSEWKPSEWVFASKTSNSGHIESPGKAHKTALLAEKLPHVSQHGLRRSFKNTADWIENLPVGVTAQIMGHAQSAIAEKHYTERPLDLLRKWHDYIEQWILEQAGIEFDYSPYVDKATSHLRLVSND